MERAQFITLMLLAFLLGGIAGLGLMANLLEYQINKGHLPKVLKDNKDKIIKLLAEG